MTALVDAIADWKVVDYAGSGDLLDGSGNGHDATLQNTPVFVPGAQPYFDMNGSSHHFTVADHADLDFAAADSFSGVFVYQNAGNPAANEWGFAKKLGFGVDAGYSLIMVDNGSGRAHIGDGAAGVSSGFPGADILPHNEIVTVAAIRDVADDQVSWMHDGTEYNAAADTTTVALSNGAALFLCADQNDTDHFTGRFHGAALFGAVLTTAEVTSIGTEILTAIPSPSTRRVISSPRYGITRMARR